MIKPTLIDAQSWGQLGPILHKGIKDATFIGYDYETEDSRRHDGLNRFCKYDEDGLYKKKGKLVFDFRRTTICGASFYIENIPDQAFYLNFNHADRENRLPITHLHWLLDAKRQGSHFVAHNAAFEQTVTKACLGRELPDLIDTLQMAVSAYGPQQYSHENWIGAGQGAIKSLLPAILHQSFTGVTDETNMEMTPDLSELVFKIIGKSSKAAFSWNGFLNDITYGYSLKKAVGSWFGYEMTTFEEVLGEDAHMGQLTGDQVVAYGADDAYWCVQLFHLLMAYMVQNGGEKLVSTFLTQENPMVSVFADIQTEGMKVNHQAIIDRMAIERAEMARIGRKMKAAVRQLLPFSEQPAHGLSKHDAWYRKSGPKYRKAIVDWALSPDDEDDFDQAYQIRGPVSIAWAAERGMKEPTGPNFSHYMPVRTLIYDLIAAKPLVKQGKIESDGEARGKLKDRLKDQKLAVEVIECINAIASVEQRVKLYLTPYGMLTDPETGRMYPTVTSMLATRRMGCSNPNGMQLAKRGESTFVRGFYEADYPDHVLVSIDWSAIELVEIGEFSGDPEFIKAFGQIPHEDMHTGAATDILRNVDCPGLTEERMKSLKSIRSWDEFIVDFENPERLKRNLKGGLMEPAEALKTWRTEVGKGANFNYWYSGWLATIGERMGWSQDQTKAATEAYRERFWVAEQWRVDKIREVQENGFITLHDGHRYVRYEATENWILEWQDKFLMNQVGSETYDKIMRWIGGKIQKRAGNQTVNADIQGSCATIAKRSIIRNNAKFREQGWTKREARFVLPIHDELLYSVHKDLVADFVPLARETMIDHPDMFRKCKLDASPAVGLTFEPWHPKKAPRGQIELYEPPTEIVGATLAGKRLNRDGIQGVVDYLFEVKKMEMAA